MSHGFCQVLARYGDERETEPALRARECWMVLGPGTDQRGAKKSSPIWGLSNWVFLFLALGMICDDVKIYKI